MTHVRVANEVVETTISVERTSTKLARGIIQAFLIFPDLIRHILIFALGTAERIRLKVEILFQSRTVSIDLGGDVAVDIAGGGDSVLGYLFCNLLICYFSGSRPIRRILVVQDQLEKFYLVKKCLFFNGKLL